MVNTSKGINCWGVEKSLLGQVLRKQDSRATARNPLDAVNSRISRIHQQNHVKKKGGLSRQSLP